MKTKSFLAMLAFIFAIGSAVASELLLATPAWTHISEVPEQGAICVQRLQCDTGTVACTLDFSVGANNYVNVKAYDGISPTAGNCGQQLSMRP
jgi:hypothetical protein